VCSDEGDPPSVSSFDVASSVSKSRIGIPEIVMRDPGRDNSAAGGAGGVKAAAVVGGAPASGVETASRRGGGYAGDEVRTTGTPAADTEACGAPPSTGLADGADSTMV